jgi:predicted phosphoadenosine phosphosulfate sulfurtransferase
MHNFITRQIFIAIDNIIYTLHHRENNLNFQFIRICNPLTTVTSLGVKLFHVLNTTINIKDMLIRLGNNQN